MKTEQGINAAAGQLKSILASTKKYIDENGDPFGIAEASYEELESLLGKAEAVIRGMVEDYSFRA